MTPRKKKARPARAVDPVTKYARDVVAKRIIAGPHVRDSCARHLRDLKEGKKRGLVWRLKEALRVIGFFESELVLTGGKKFLLQPWQKFIVGSLFGWYRDDGTRRFNVGYVETAKGNGKALALDTPIPTPQGWSMMGDLKAGDTVFDEMGKPTEILEAHRVRHQRACYRVTFDDGESIVADEEHLWVTRMRRYSSDRGAAMRSVERSRRGGWKLRARTTGEIARTVRYPNRNYQSANHSIALAGSLDTPAAGLSVDPYVLGAWLGDGESCGSRITIGVQDGAELTGHIRAAGEPIKRLKDKITYAMTRPRGNRDLTLKVRLRSLGVLNAKHIPQIYLRASIAQRLSLLQGLCDTDGSPTRQCGGVELVTTSATLASGYRELIVSLGMKVSMLPPKMKTAQNGNGSLAYRLQFWPPTGTRVFRLARKHALMGVTTGRARLSQERRIVAVVPVPSTPVRCIRVAAASSLFLAGKGMIPTHNTPLAAGIGLVGLLIDGEEAAEIYSAAVSKEQARIVFDDAKRMVEESQSLDDAIDENLTSSLTVGRSVFRPLSSEQKGLDGKRPHMSLIDELHEHSTDKVLDKLRLGTKFRRNPITLSITNAGFDRLSVCWREHEYGVKVASGAIENDSWFSYVCALDEKDDYRDEKVWIKTSPNLGVSVHKRYIQQLLVESEDQPSKLNLILRLNFCVWTESHTVWVPDATWSKNAGTAGPAQIAKVNRRRPAWIGLEISATTDFAAAVTLFPDDADSEAYDMVLRFWLCEEAFKRRLKLGREPYELWRSEGLIAVTAGSATDYDAIERALLSDTETYDVKEVVFDRNWASSLIAHLQDELGEERVVQFGTTGNAMNAPVNEIERLAAHAKLRHGGNPVMRWQIANVAITSSGGLKRINKEKSTETVVGPIALAMAMGRAMVRNAPAPDEEEDNTYDEMEVRTL